MTKKRVVFWIHLIMKVMKKSIKVRESLRVMLQKVKNGSQRRRTADDGDIAGSDAKEKDTHNIGVENSYNSGQGNERTKSLILL